MPGGVSGPGVVVVQNPLVVGFECALTEEKIVQMVEMRNTRAVGLWDWDAAELRRGWMAS